MTGNTLIKKDNVSIDAYKNYLLLYHCDSLAFIQNRCLNYNHPERQDFYSHAFHITPTSRLSLLKNLKTVNSEIWENSLHTLFHTYTYWHANIRSMYVKEGSFRSLPTHQGKNFINKITIKLYWETEIGICARKNVFIIGHGNGNLRCIQ